jgi:hypothetical protein
LFSVVNSALAQGTALPSGPSDTPAREFSGAHSDPVTIANSGNNVNGHGRELAKVNASALNGLNFSNVLQTGGNQVASSQFANRTNNQASAVRAANQPAPDKKGGKSSKASGFREANATDLVLEYYRPDTIYMKQPDAHEGRFLTIFNRDNIAAEITRRVANHNLAVIVMGDLYSPDQEAALFSEWKSLLGSCGFQRVVFLRFGRGKQIDGLPIVHDSVIASANDSGKTITTLAAVPSAP